MITMALDHASMLIGRMHFLEVWGIPFPGYPAFAWWLTRFLSHLCAPGFFFLMGMSIFLFAEKRLRASWNTKMIYTCFLKRGGLIFLFMLFLETPAFFLGMISHAPLETVAKTVLPGAPPNGFFFPTTVLYGLAACIIIGGFLWRLKGWQLLLITLSSFALSWLYITNSNPHHAFSRLEHLLIVPGMSPGIFILYPIIPWLGLTTFGIFWAQLLQKMPERIYKLSLGTGLAFITVSVGLRFMEWGNFNIANNDDWINFFTLVKYPPSITFALITCGINLVLLFLFSIIASKTWLQPIKIFGQTAMFFYIAHLYLFALLSFAFPDGCAIGIMYFIWMLGLVILYFICNCFLKFKQSKPNASLWRMV